MTNADAPPTYSGRKVDWWFDQYAVCHQNHTNKLIHYICVPAIVASVLGLCWAIPVPGDLGPWFNVATLVTALATVFNFRLSPVLGFGMLLFTLPLLGLFYWLTTSGNGALVWQGSLAVFVVSWILQFLGHKIEGAKPAFLDDLKFLLIGPLWVLGAVCRRLGIRY